MVKWTQEDHVTHVETPKTVSRKFGVEVPADRCRSDDSLD